MLDNHTKDTVSASPSSFAGERKRVMLGLQLHVKCTREEGGCRLVVMMEACS